MYVGEKLQPRPYFQIGDSTLQADWISSTHISLKQLHSKCLYVDHLPPNYRDMAAYRKIFSVVKNPPYCQVKKNEKHRFCV
jgi:hypothetical protein